MMKTIEIYWKDLSPAAQQEIADQLGTTPEAVERESNWDVFPMATADIEIDAHSTEWWDDIISANEQGVCV